MNKVHSFLSALWCCYFLTNQPTKACSNCSTHLYGFERAKLFFEHLTNCSVWFQNLQPHLTPVLVWAGWTIYFRKQIALSFAHTLIGRWHPSNPRSSKEEKAGWRSLCYCGEPWHFSWGPFLQQVGEKWYEGNWESCFKYKSYIWATLLNSHILLMVLTNRQNQGSVC